MLFFRSFLGYAGVISGFMEDFDTLRTEGELVTGLEDFCEGIKEYIEAVQGEDVRCKG